MALKFGLLLAAAIMLAEGLGEWAGDFGILAAAGISGLADVDAATLTIVRITPDQISVLVGVGAILLASAANVVFKAAIAIFNSKGALLSQILLGIGTHLLALIGGLLVSWFLLEHAQSVSQI